MSKYKSLARLFHADRSSDSFANNKRLAQERLESDSTFRTGIVTPLGEIFTAVPCEQALLSEHILVTERRISLLWNQFSGVMRWDYIRHFISEELFATNEIEGVRSTRKETQAAVEAAEKARKNGSETHARFSEFARLYLNLTDEKTVMPSSIADIRSLYDKVVFDEIAETDQPDGDLFRAGDVEIQGPHGTVVHTGVSGEGAISALMTNMLHLAVGKDMPRLLSAIMSHFLFEYIHPFYDGNGRTGRYLLALYLSQSLTKPTVLSLSRTIAEHKNDYYKAFSEAENPLNHGELTFFVMTVLQLISTAQEELIDDFSVRVDRMNKASTICGRLAQEYDLSEQARSVLFAVMQEALFDSTKAVSLDGAADLLHASKQTARKYMSSVVEAGLAAQVSGRPLKIGASDRLKNILATSD